MSPEGGQNHHLNFEPPVRPFGGGETYLPWGVRNHKEKTKRGCYLLYKGCRVSVGTGHVFTSIVVRPQIAQALDNTPCMTKASNK